MTVKHSTDFCSYDECMRTPRDENGCTLAPMCLFGLGWPPRTHSPPSQPGARSDVRAPGGGDIEVIMGPEDIVELKQLRQKTTCPACEQGHLHSTATPVDDQTVRWSFQCSHTDCRFYSPEQYAGKIYDA